MRIIGRFHSVLASNAKIRSGIIPSRSVTVNDTRDDLVGAPHHPASARNRKMASSWNTTLQTIISRQPLSFRLVKQRIQTVYVERLTHIESLDLVATPSLEQLERIL